MELAKAVLLIHFTSHRILKVMTIEYACSLNMSTAPTD